MVVRNGPKFAPLNIRPKFMGLSRLYLLHLSFLSYFMSDVLSGVLVLFDALRLLLHKIALVRLQLLLSKYFCVFFLVPYQS